MMTTPQQPFEKTVNPNPLQYKEIVKCPKCFSPFVDKFCDSCGFKLTPKEILDTDLTEDFYQIKDSYMDHRSAWIIMFPFSERLFQRSINIYLLKLKRRVKTLLELMMRADFHEGSTTFKTLYQLEFNDSLKEIVHYQGNLQSLQTYPEKVYRELTVKRIAVDSERFAALKAHIINHAPRAQFYLLQNMKEILSRYYRELKLLFICTGSLAIVVAMAFYTLKLFSA